MNRWERGSKPLTGFRYGRLDHKMDHLACFAAGMYGLAAHEEKDDNSERWMEVAKVTYLKISLLFLFPYLKKIFVCQCEYLKIFCLTNHFAGHN